MAGEAIAICAAERPDWVLMDLRMKPIDGLRAIAQIKARFPEVRIAIVSQYDDDELRAEATRVGACAYVLKENLQELTGILAGMTLGAIAGGLDDSTDPKQKANPLKTPTSKPPTRKHNRKADKL